MEGGKALQLRKLLQKISAQPDIKLSKIIVLREIFSKVALVLFVAKIKHSY